MSVQANIASAHVSESHELKDKSLKKRKHDGAETETSSKKKRKHREQQDAEVVETIEKREKPL